MMYQIFCDGVLLHDPQTPELTVWNPTCNLEVNTAGEASFTVLSDHPNYGALRKLRSVVEIRRGGGILFRGRITGDSRDFQNRMTVDVEGVLAYTNDSVIPPFCLPENAPASVHFHNMVEWFFRWILEQHNRQVEPWQQLKFGRCTVREPGNYITRSWDDYETTWEILKTQLLESSLGGYLTVRYEADGNYVDYLSDLEEVSPQAITFGENLLDLVHEVDANETHSAMFPVGGEVERVIQDGGLDEEGHLIDAVVRERVTLENLPDGALTEDVVKKGTFLYSKSAVASYGWICAPVETSTWEDVTEAADLRAKALEALSQNAVKLTDTVTVSAVDLSLTDEEISAFRVGQYVRVNSPAHGISGVRYPLTKLQIDMANPQNTKITLGATKRILTDRTNVAAKRAQAATAIGSSVQAQLSGKIGRSENNTVANMVNNATAQIILKERLSVESPNFNLSADGILRTVGMVAEHAVIRSEGDGKTVELKDGIICVDSMIASDTDDHWGHILMTFKNVYGQTMAVCISASRSYNSEDQPVIEYGDIYVVPLIGG